MADWLEVAGLIYLAIKAADDSLNLFLKAYLKWRNGRDETDKTSN